MKKILLYISLLILASCTEDGLTSLNENTKKPLNVSYETLFSNAQLELTDLITSSNVNDNIFRLIVQYWTETTYLDETRYDLAGRNIPQNFWHPLYRDVLNDLRESKTLLENDETVTEAEKENQLAIIDIMQVYTWSVLVQTFGNIPYDEALNIDDIRPVYGDQSAVFDDLLARLDTDISTLDAANGAGNFEGADLVYAGDIPSWLMFANSLKLRLGMTLADVSPDKAATVVAEAAPNAFQSNADNAIFEYSTIPPNTNPIWDDLVQSGRQDFVAATTIVTAMDSLNDSRMKYYFTIDGDVSDGMYSGGTVGVGNSFSAFSKPDSTITAADFQSILLSYSEVEFFLAEAVERGMSVSGTAETHYNNAITASFMYWGGTAQEAQTYLAQPDVAYATAGGDYKEKIGLQKWIALYNRGFESWTEWRRLDYPELEPAVRAVSAIPLRYTYPVSEQNLNKPNFEEAAQAIGGDEVTTKLFWDMN